MTNKEKIIDLCVSSLKEKDLYDKEHQERLTLEIKEINSQSEFDYFSDLYEKKTEFKYNENNLLIPFLLGITNDFNIEKDVQWNYGEYPDIDIDFLPQVRDYLKGEYAKKEFGEEFICNIASYNTFGMRSALIDMARIFGKDDKEIKSITTKLAPKDEEGKELTWEQALEIYSDLKEYHEKNPEITDAATRLMHRNRSMGQHASGLIISELPIKDFVPLVQGKGGSPASAWVEGLHGTDLGAVGLIKFDFLSLDGNMKIALAAKMALDCIKGTTNNISESICALDDQPSWSDTSYLNDKKALEMASKGDLEMIFQFDGSPGIRNLAKKGGVDSFDDLVAYTALFRPGPMKLGYHEKYCKRKKGKEEYKIHPLLADFMSSTYGVLTYQEQIMRLLNVVGQVPLKDCEAVRKAISKKKIEKFKSYKETFIKNGQKLLECSEEEMEHLWAQIEAFAGYGFNLSHAVAYTYISSRMLYLKAHYPKEFYAAVFTEVKTAGPDDYAKLKNYRKETEKHGIIIQPIDINKSKASFNIVDDKVYYGFAKIRGVGDDVAKRIEEGQPYSGLVDFLKRFGTDQKVVQALIGLGCFKERDPLTLYEFYKEYKNYEKKQSDRRKRFENSKKNIMEQMKEVENDPFLQDKLRKTIANFDKKGQFIEEPNLSRFTNAKDKIDEDEIKLMTNPEVAEMNFYGFTWDPPLKRYENLQGYTFKKFTEDNMEIGWVEGFVQSITKRESKGKKTVYYQALVEDVLGQSKFVNIWEVDYKRFENELQKWTCLKLLLQSPKPPYNTFSLYSWPRGKKKEAVDQRVTLLKRDYSASGTGQIPLSNQIS